MTSRQFFGGWKFKDISIDLFNKDNERIFESRTTTFAHVNPIIKEEVANAIREYKADWEYKGEPTRCEIFTTPAYNVCKIDLITKKKEFVKY